MHGCHGPACPVQTDYFIEPLPLDMTMWMDKINDHIDYNSMGDSYYCNIGILYWKWTVLFSESSICAMFTTCV